MDTVIRLAEPLDQADRDTYLREVAAALDGRAEIGDGFVARVRREVQSRLFRPLDRLPPQPGLTGVRLRLQGILRNRRTCRSQGTRLEALNFEMPPGLSARMRHRPGFQYGKNSTQPF